MNIVNSQSWALVPTTYQTKVYHLRAALKDKHCKLKELNLGYNALSDQGVSLMCAALKDEL